MKSTLLQKKLAAYSAMATAICAASNADAQIVYTDVNPDVTINTGDTYEVDLNNDGVVDFKTHAGKNNANTWKSVEIYTSLSLNNNQVAAYLGQFSYYYANLLSFGNVIDENENFYPAYPYVTLNFVYATGSVQGAWHGAIDGYAGLLFDINGEQHYGWIRLDVAEDASSAVIKDFAYESTIEKAIIAGDNGNVGIQSVKTDNAVIIYAHNGLLSIVANGIALPATIKITNLIGQVVSEFELKNSKIEISISELPHQLLVVSVFDGAKIYSSKISL